MVEAVSDKLVMGFKMIRGSLKATSFLNFMNGLIYSLKQEGLNKKDTEIKIMFSS